MEAEGKCPATRTPHTGFPSLFQGPLGAGSSGTAVPQLEHQPFLLPACPELALLHPSHPTAPRDEVPRFLPAFRSCHLLLSRDTGWAHGDKDTQQTTAAATSAPGAHSVHLPWDLVGRIQSMQWDSSWEKHFGTQLPVTVIPAQDSSAGAVNFHVFPRFL